MHQFNPVGIPIVSKDMDMKRMTRNCSLIKERNEQVQCFCFFVKKKCN